MDKIYGILYDTAGDESNSEFAGLFFTDELGQLYLRILVSDYTVLDEERNYVDDIQKTMLEEDVILPRSPLVDLVCGDEYSKYVYF